MYVSICHMKRTTIFVPEALERDLQLYASRVGKPAASIVREAVAEYLTRRQPAAGRVPSFTGAFKSGHTDTAERHEALLFSRLSPHGEEPPAATYRPRRSRAIAPRRRRKAR